MTVLRCERVAAGDLDRAVADLGELTLARMPEGVFVDVADDRANDTILCGTTMTFLGAFPSKARFTPSSASTACSISLFPASRATVTSARFPLARSRSISCTFGG